MKKQFRKILLLCGAVAVLAASLFLLKDSEPEKNTEVPEDTTLFSFGATELTGAEIMNDEGGYSLKITDSAGTIESLSGFATEEKKLKNAVSACRKVKYAEKISDGSSRLEEFGLASPATSVTVTATSGRVSFSVGDAVPGVETESRYVFFNGEVYAVYKTYLTTFLWGEKDFVAKTLTPELGDTEQPIYPVFVSVASFGRVFSIKKTESASVMGYTLANYQISEPVLYAADTSAAVELFGVLFGLNADGVAALLKDGGQPALYSLEDPESIVTLVYTDVSGKEEKRELLLSERNADGSSFCMLRGGNTVYTLNAPPEALYNTDYTPYLSRELPYLPVAALESVTLEFTGAETYEMKLVREEGTGLSVMVNGNKTAEDSFKNFYYILISAQLDKVDVSGKAGVETPAVLRVEYRGTDETMLVTEFVSLSERTLEARSDGVCCGELSVRTVHELETAAQRLAAGEEIKARY